MAQYRWQIPNRIPQNYRSSLHRLKKKIEKELEGVTDPNEIVRILNQIPLTKQFQTYAYQSAMKMVDNVYKHGKGRWRKTVIESPQGRKMYEAIQNELQTSQVGTTYYNLIQSNADYITKTPLKVAQELTHTVQHQAGQGLRAEEIATNLKQQYPKMLQSKLDLIARTETSKAQSALTQSRAQSLGIDWYVWRTSKDSRVRSSHDHMDGVLIRWSDPPSPEALDPAREQKPYGNYHAGNTFNCRCYAEPVVSVDFLTFPCKVYYGGKIQRMTRAEFEKVA